MKKKSTLKPDEKPAAKKSGRPPKYKTEEERLEAKRSQNKVYQKRYHRNKRKPRYAEDPAFREQILSRERDRYIRDHPEYEPKMFGARAGQAASFAEVKLVKVGKVNRNTPVLTIDKMAEFIGNSPKIMGEWVESGKFPRPNHETVEGQRVFTVSQANAMASVLKSHLKNRATFRQSDTRVIRELHASFK